MMDFTFGQLAAVAVVGGFGVFLLGCAFALHPATRPSPRDGRELARTCLAIGAVSLFMISATLITRWIVG